MAAFKAKSRRVALGVLGFSLMLVLAGVALYRSGPALLVLDSGPCRAEAIVVLGGDRYGRPLRAAELFRSNAAPIVVVSGAGDAVEVVSMLKQHGVPQSAIRLEDRSSSTFENARFSVALLRTDHVRTAIVVTSWFHSRRALKCFRKAAPEMTFYSRPSYYGFERTDWSRSGISTHIRAEYVKLAGYWVWYGVWPF